MENIYVIIYAILWLIVLLIHYTKVRTVDAGFVLVFSYLLYAVSSYALYTDIYFGHIYSGLSFIPFLILFFLLYVTAKPILLYGTYQIKKIHQPCISIVNFFCWMYIIMSVISIPGILSNLKLMSLIINMQGADIYAENVSDSVYTASSMGSGISNIVSLYTNFFSRISVLFLFYHLTLPQKNKKIIIGLILSIIVYVFSYLLTGQRGGTFKMITTCAITFFALKQFISPSINKVIIRLSIVGLILVCIPYYFLTISRFSDITEGFWSAIYSYTGQGNLNFNLYALDNNGIRYGDRIVPLFKKFLGFQNVPSNFWERRWKYPDLRINDESFVTYVGDFVLDFGPFFATFILCSISLFIQRKTRVKNGVLYFHQLILLHFLMCLCMEGGMSLFSFADSSNVVILVYAFMYFLFKYAYIGQIKVYNKV